MNFLWNFFFTNEEYEHSYRLWAKGGRGWDGTQFGGTYQMRALMWYHHRRGKRNSEWRPKLILEALKEASTHV